jgi:hypothetical protein
MSAQPGFDGQLRMVELAVEPHAETFQHRTRLQVGDGGEGDELFQMELLEAKRDGRLRGLRGIAQAPVWFGQAPSHFHAGRERELVGGNM